MKKKTFGKDVEETRTIPFVFSDESRDSYGTVLPVDGWDLKRFENNGIALYNHDSWGDPDKVIGSARAWVKDKQLLGEITFESGESNPLAEKVFRKYLSGIMKGVSVRFMPTESGKWGVGEEAVDGSTPTYYYGKRELLEISCVPIPANKNAVARSMGNEMSEEAGKEAGFYATGTVRMIEEEEPEQEAPAIVHTDARTADYTDTYVRAYETLCKTF